MPRQARSKVGILGIPFSKGQPKGGAEMGPEILRQAGLVSRIKRFDYEVVDHGDIEIESIPGDKPDGNVKNPRSVGRANKKISDKVASIVKSKELCLNLGGDHSIAIGSIHGHCRAEPGLVVVWVDAHADINTPLSSPSGNMHGMPLSLLVKELADRFSPVEGFDWCKPCIHVRDIVYIGLRDVDEGERWIIDQFGIPAYSMQEIDKMGIKEVMHQALKNLDPNGTRPIHLSFDVDGLDPTITPSTGTPVLGGLNIREGQYIMEELANTGRLSAIDIVEVNPLLGSEKDNMVTAETTISVIEKCFGSKRGGYYPASYVFPSL
ncbi:arginase, hepatic [Patella vulgata]|uniref:arginase, hepatic n=1 Tax=Patella vulgata TaxID=6465 RepID=UPI0021804BD8|nr:arginase, hepatic [Patella vulgata]